MHKTANVVALIALIALSGCGRILVPYESEFMCALGDDYGKCSNVEDAYDTALGDSGSASSTSVLRCSEAQARLGLCVQTEDDLEAVAVSSPIPVSRHAMPRTVDFSHQKEKMSPHDGGRPSFQSRGHRSKGKPHPEKRPAQSQVSPVISARPAATGAVSVPMIAKPLAQRAPAALIPIAPGQQPGTVKPVRMQPVNPAAAKLTYNDQRYREMASLIAQPVTPILKPTKVLRTLIVGYSTGKTMYMPRFIYFMASEPEFVLSDGLNPPGAGDVVFPTSIGSGK